MGTGADSGAQQPQGQWTTGLFGCFEDLDNCSATCSLPCFFFGQNAEIIDKGEPTCTFAGASRHFWACIGCACFYTFTYRGKLRRLFDLPEDPCNDFCVHFFCNFCAICQEYRELRNRGLNPMLGWRFNVENMNIATQVPPNVARMAR